MDRQARTRDTVLVKRREITGRSQTLPWLFEGRGVMMTETKYIGLAVYTYEGVSRHELEPAVDGPLPLGPPVGVGGHVGED